MPDRVSDSGTHPILSAEEFARAVHRCAMGEAAPHELRRLLAHDVAQRLTHEMEIAVLTKQRDALQSEIARNNAIDYELMEQWQDGEGALRGRVAVLETALRRLARWNEPSPTFAGVRDFASAVLASTDTGGLSGVDQETP